MDAESAASPAPLHQGAFSGQTQFADLVRQAFSTAAREGWREIILSDPGFDDWPLGERAVSESLNTWAGSGRRFTMLAKNYRELTIRHARFVNWRRTWAHIIDCSAVSSADELEFPSAIWSPNWVMHRLDNERCRGVCGPEPERRVLLREQLGEWLKKSSASFPATTLGL